jgi:chromosome segregation ATPase
MVKENTESNAPGNEVDNIRKILFGDQIAQVEERFNQVERSIAQLRTENRNLRQALEAELTGREKAIQDLTNMVESALQERDETRGENLSDQAELFSALQQALQQYKAKISLPLEIK